MKFSRSAWLPPLLTGLLGVLALWFWYGDVLQHPNRHQLLESSDASKNYYTIAYHVAHDSSYSIFEGMNYPYGEHILFTDNQPLLSTLMKLVDEHVVEIWGYTVGIVNLLMFLSALLGMVITARICQHFELPIVVSVIFPVLILLLCPQFIRMKEHYALSYMHVLPLTWWLWIKAQHRHRLRYGLLLALHLLSASLLHLYYLAIAGGFVAFLSLLALVDSWRQISKQALLQRLGLLALQLLLPVVVIKLWLWLSFPVEDRIENPTGGYLATLQSVFLPGSFPLGQWLNETLQWPGNGEIRVKEVYAGLSVTLAQLAIIPWAIYRLVRTRRVKLLWRPSGFGGLDHAYWAALLLLLMAMRADEGLLEAVGLPGDLLQQFRFRQRLAWPFFLVANLGVLVWIHRLPWGRFRLPGRLAPGGMSWQQPVWVLAGLVLALEGAWFQSHHMELDQTSNPFRPSSSVMQQVKAAPLDPTAYQALMPVPYFHGGAEAVGVWPPNATSDGRVTALPEAISLATGLPMTAVLLSRTSLHQSRQNLQFVFSGYFGQELLQQMPSEQPLLLVRNDSLSNNLRPSGIPDAAGALPIRLELPNSTLRFYSHPLSNFRQRRSAHLAKGKRLCEYLPEDSRPFQVFTPQSSAFKWQPASAFTLKHSGVSSQPGLRKEAAIRFRKGQNGLSLDVPLPQSPKQGTQQPPPPQRLSFWAKVDVANANYVIKYLDSDSNLIGHDHWFNYSQKLKQIWRGWQLYEIFLRPPPGAKRVQLMHHMQDGPIWVQQVLLRPHNSTLLWHDDQGGVFLNNRYYDEVCPEKSPIPR